MTARRTVDSRSSETEDDVQPRPTNRQPSRRNELGPIIRSKIQPPALRPTTLTRQRLIDQLREATSHRLTLLIAEAGYGKTTLLADFARVSGTRTLWYRLDENDADVVDLVSYVIAAARELDPDIGQPTIDLIGEIAKSGPPPKRAFISSLISDLADLDPVPTLLVLDDFHTLDESSDAVDLVNRLVRDAPPWLHLLIASRNRPDVELGRLAASGEFAELHTDDLRFSRDETSQMFTSVGISLDDDVLTALDSRTRGWVASLQLFHSYIRGRPPSDIRNLSRALSGAASPVYEFLAQEVLANVDASIRLFLIRASVLQEVGLREVTALVSDLATSEPAAEAARLIEEADRLGLLMSSTMSSDGRQMHPLLRDFFSRELRQEEDSDSIRAINARVAEALSSVDPLGAAQYFAAAGRDAEAMSAINQSLIETIGSGRWGVASRLVASMSTTPIGPAVAAIRARQLMAEGDLAGAALMLDSSDVETAPADVRAVFRQTSLSLGWRLGDRERMFDSLTAIDADLQTPSILKATARVLLDTSPSIGFASPLPQAGQRLAALAAEMLDEKLTFHSAIALHDSALAFLNAGLLTKALEMGAQALDRFSQLTFFAVEQLSTHTALAVVEQELGHTENSVAHVNAALSSGMEMADVPAELARLVLSLGNSNQSLELIALASSLQRQNRSDAVGDALLDCAIAASELRSNVKHAIQMLENVSFDNPMELGYALERDALLAQALLLDGRKQEASQLISSSLQEARRRRARRVEVRLEVLDALASRDKGRFDAAVAAAHAAGTLANLELADVIVKQIDFLSPMPPAVSASIKRYPARWLPAIRRKLDDGGTLEARLAASLLDEFGAIEDVGRVRAFAKTYVKKGPWRSLGKSLARRTSPLLVVRDLGPTTLSIDGRDVRLATIRRKSASVLMYLITRPDFSANREQAVDSLWPEADPESAVNNLNQALFFLRRKIDPWYEDDLSVEYIELQGDLIWLDTDLVRAESTQFAGRARSRGETAVERAELVLSYRGQFAPEFEYEEWAMPWRSRVHASFLETAHSVCDELVVRGDLQRARDVANHVLRVDSSASDVELKLIWLYGKLGMTSAAQSLYDSLCSQEEAEPGQITPLHELLRGPLPTHL